MCALGVQPIPKLLDARAAAGPGAALASDVGDRARSIVDRGIDIAIRGGVAQAHEHRD
jgi:DNA-binding transcriptional LysR family regulator